MDKKKSRWEADQSWLNWYKSAKATQYEQKGRIIRWYKVNAELSIILLFVIVSLAKISEEQILKILQMKLILESWAISRVPKIS